MDYLVYMLIFTESNIYIGLTNNVTRRVREHRASFTNHFELEILYQNLTKEDACKLETDLINKYRLEYGSKLLNKADKSIAPTGVSGPSHAQSKLTDEQVKELRHVWLESKGILKLNDLAHKFNTSVTTIHNILQNKSYIDFEYEPIGVGFRKKKLTLEDVYAIRVEYKETHPTQASLAIKYDITSQYLGRLVKGLAMPEAGGPLLGKDYKW